MSVREASHAGSWYTSNTKKLNEELETWLAAVPSTTRCIGTESSKGSDVTLPVQRARVIIAPHAGYAYSGPAAAWAYKSLDLSNVKRIFLLGPSHHHYLSGCALSQCDYYDTPLGKLALDKDTIAELEATKKFDRMAQSVDEAEHSMEMHLPYIYKVLDGAFENPSCFPRLIPVLVGNTSINVEKQFGKIFAPYLADSTSIFIVSSDFCHWGSRFRYTYYQPPDGPALQLRSGDKISSARPLHESIALVDLESMDAVEGGSHEKFWDQLNRTGNTVCGRHPIGVVLSAIESMREEDTISPGESKFRFLHYDRSEKCRSIRDSSIRFYFINPEAGNP